MINPRRPVRAFLLPSLLLGVACAPPPPAPAPPEPAPAPTTTPAPPPAAPAPAAPAPEDERPYVVVISFDGMRYDYIDRVPTPNFDRVAESGVRAAGLIPGYPSKTFPNHYSLATGLYPSRHGLVDNAFYDPAFDAEYALGDRDAVRDGRWYGGEPIWVTAETQGVRAASYFWVGTEAPIQGVHPSIFKEYDESVPYVARVDSVLAWLAQPAGVRPQLVLLYFDEPDHAGHEGGPADPGVDSAVVALDRILGRLLDGIEGLQVRDRLTLLLVSDHGMEASPAGQVVQLDDYADLTGVRVVNNTTQALLYFDGHEERMWATYEALNDRLEHATAYLREETPARWHYRDGRRIGDIVVAADPGWVIRTPGGRPWTGGGMHGWDPYHRPMNGIFLAAGAGIRPGIRIPTFENVHVYPLLAELLELRPAAGIDGRLEVLAEILTAPAAR
jgi:predicted AlkP superfamily pyrophosphatase or phosphodiesterase